MPDELEALLDRCLDARAEGRPLEACLAELGSQARSELEPLVLLVEAMRNAPRPGLSAAASAAHERNLLARAAQRWDGGARSPAGARRRWFPIGFLAGWRLSFVPAATALVLVASLLLVGGAGAMVSNARTDEPLYNLKLSWEQAQLLAATNDAQRARVAVDIAQNRMAEIESLVQAGRPVPEELLLQVQLYLNQATSLSAGLSGRDAVPVLRRVSELLAYERLLLARYLASLPAPDRVTVELALRNAEEAQQSATQTLEERVDEQLSGPAGSQPATPGDSSVAPRALGRQIEQPAPPPAPPKAVPRATVPDGGSATRPESQADEATRDESGETSGRSFGQARAAEAHGNAPDLDASGQRGAVQQDEAASRGRRATSTPTAEPQVLTEPQPGAHNRPSEPRGDSGAAGGAGQPGNSGDAPGHSVDGPPPANPPGNPGAGQVPGSERGNSGNTPGSSAPGRSEGGPREQPRQPGGKPPGR